jgi:hypothetical protein
LLGNNFSFNVLYGPFDILNTSFFT